MHSRKSLIEIFFILSILISLQACQYADPLKKSLEALKQGIESGPPDPVSPPILISSPPGAVVLTSISGGVDTDLGTLPKIEMNISSDSTINEIVKLTIEKDELDQIDVAQSIKLYISNPSFKLNPNSKVFFQLTLDVSTMAPTVMGSHFHVLARSVATNQVLANLQIPFAVHSVYEIMLYGGSPTELWNSPSTVAFTSHPEGVTVRFINMDPTDAHIIHSTGPIPHGDTTMPMAPSVNGKPGGIYQYTVTTQSPVGDTYYCHLHEGGNEARTLTFNTPQSFPPSNNPNATYSYIRDNIFSAATTSKCVTCHGGAGGVTLDSYLNTLKTVTPGNYLASSLFNSVDSGAMPLGGTKLTDLQILAIKDWITSGAPNN